MPQKYQLIKDSLISFKSRKVAFPHGHDSPPSVKVLTVPSPDAVIAKLPMGATAMSSTCPRCPVQRRTTEPVRPSHADAVPSNDEQNNKSLPAASCQASLVIPPSRRIGSWRSFSEFKSQINSLPARDPVAAKGRPEDNATASTESSSSSSSPADAPESLVDVAEGSQTGSRATTLPVLGLTREARPSTDPVSSTLPSRCTSMHVMLSEWTSLSFQKLSRNEQKLLRTYVKRES